MSQHGGQRRHGRTHRGEQAEVMHHLVGGVNIRKNIVAKMTPISRHTGPRATPGTRLRRNMMNIDTNSDSAVIRKPNRRDSEPSTVGRIR